MHEALLIAATGLHAQQQQVEAISSNLANMATSAYKRARVQFSDLVMQARAASADPLQGPSTAATAGVGVTSTVRVFEAGELRRTEQPLDLAIQGDGFLEVVLPDGQRAFTRGGSLKVNADGQLATAAGWPLKPGIAIPDEATALTISATGRVQFRLPGQSAPVEAGQLDLVRFSHPSGLAMQDDNLYRVTEASGEPIAGRQGDAGLGTLVQGALEQSNVKLSDELLQLMVAQRAYGAAARVVQAADEMLGLVNGLRR